MMRWRTRRSRLRIVVADDVAHAVGGGGAEHHQVALAQLRLHARAGDGRIGDPAAERGGREAHPRHGADDERDAPEEDPGSHATHVSPTRRR